MLDMLDWCRKCKNKCTEKEKMRLGCLGCKWQYVGQSVFDRKADLFEEDISDKNHETPYEYWKGYNIVE